MHLCNSTIWRRARPPKSGTVGARPVSKPPHDEAGPKHLHHALSPALIRPLSLATSIPFRRVNLRLLPASPVAGAPVAIPAPQRMPQHHPLFLRHDTVDRPIPFAGPPATSSIPDLGSFHRQPDRAEEYDWISRRNIHRPSSTRLIPPTPSFHPTSHPRQLLRL